MELAIKLSYLVAAVLFMLGLKKLSSPATARLGNRLSMAGMGLAVAATLFTTGIISYRLILIGVATGVLIGVVSAVKVRMTSMPEMIALFNGSGGAASALVAMSEYHRSTPGIESFTLFTICLSVIIGGVTFTGSLLAFGKLKGVMGSRPFVYRGHQVVSILAGAAVIALSAWLLFYPESTYVFWSIAFVSLLLGVLVVLPIGGADMPVVIALLNSYSGLAVAMTGFVLKNYSLIIVGALVGASGIILTRIMCEAMNRSLVNVLFGAFGAGGGADLSAPVEGGAGAGAKGALKSYTVEDAAVVMENSSSLIIVPGYGMAAARAQRAVRELADLLEKKGVSVKYAIHPVAGRMPGHMNVLLAEADVPYDKLFAMEDINDEFSATDVVLVVGANDVVNPAARTDAGSPLYGMPVLNADRARTVIVLKRSMAPGFSGVENELFFLKNTMMVFGDARETIEMIVKRLKEG